MREKIFKNVIKEQIKDLLFMKKFTCDLASDKTVNLLQDLYDKSQGFLQLITGKGPSGAEAKSLLSAIPEVEGINYDNKADIVVFNLKGKIIGVIDLLMGYPEKTTLSIGLLLIDPAYRGIGLGSAIFEQCLNFTKKEFYLRKVSLIVQEANDAALHFWKSRNFRLIVSRNSEETGNTEFIMELDLTI